MDELVLQEAVENKIYLIRGHKVMLDRDLAMLYQIPTKVLIQAVKRNSKRFPADFMLLLTRQEVTILRSQFVTSSWGGRRYMPYAFTEQGVAMLSTVLNSERAIQVNIAIMRAFVKLRHFLATHKELAEKLNELEQKFDRNDKDILVIFEAIRRLMEPPPVPPKPRIGFRP